MKTISPLIPVEVLLGVVAGTLIGVMLQAVIKNCAEDDPALASAIQTSLVVVLVVILGVGVVGQFLTSKKPKGGRL
jgi:NhaP-type Na+/H+ or K+/H+ antiporter